MPNISVVEICEFLHLVFELSRKQDWEEAVHWYDNAVNMMDYDEGGDFDALQDEPCYLLLARMAEMYQVGGFNLTADPQRAGIHTDAVKQYILNGKTVLIDCHFHTNLSNYLSVPAGDMFTQAAEAAMEAMKGRLANQYYMKAEEAWALMEE